MSITTDGPTTTAVELVDNESASETGTYQTSAELPPGGNPDTELSESTTGSDSDVSEDHFLYQGGTVTMRTWTLSKQEPTSERSSKT